MRSYLEAIAHGLRVFPYSPERKQPCIRNFPDLASMDVDMILAWVDQFPASAPAVATGRGLLVLDVDEKNGKSGHATLDVLGWVLPPTLTARTKSGGVHYYFRVPEDFPHTISAGALGPGLDTRCNRGFVVYYPATGELADAPEYLLDALRGIDAHRATVKAVDTPTVEHNEEDEARVREAMSYLDPDSGRDEWLHTLMALRSTGWDVAEEIAREWSASSDAKYDEDEFDKAWRTISPEGGITLGTLFKKASDAGYRGPTVNLASVFGSAPPPPAPTASDEPAPQQLDTLDTFVTLAEIPGAFAGWVYLLDQHAAVSPKGEILRPDAFRTVFGGHRWVIDSEAKIVRDAWEAFTQAEGFRPPMAKATCFRPLLPCGPVADGDIILANTYYPKPGHRIEGDASRVLDFLHRLLPDERDYQILLGYMAGVVQYPGVKFQWWPVVQGTEGNGKTFLSKAVSYAVGECYTFTPNVAEIARSGLKFTGWIEGHIFLALEEVYVPSRRDFLEEFKVVVTNDRAAIERKGVDARTGDNFANGMMFTNHLDGVPATIDGRRYAHFFTAQQNAADLVRDGMDGDYFSDLYDWACGRNKYAHGGKQYGFGVFANFLATYKIPDEYNPTKLARAPETSSKAAALNLSKGALEQELEMILESDAPGLRGGWVSSIILQRALQAAGIKSRVPWSKWVDMLESLGYIRHPAFTAASPATPSAVMPDGGRPRLFIRRDHPMAVQMAPIDAARHYQIAQGATPSDSEKQLRAGNVVSINKA